MYLSIEPLGDHTTPTTNVSFPFQALVPIQCLSLRYMSDLEQSSSFGRVDADRRVGRRELGRLLWSSKSHKRKKLVPSCSSAKLVSAKVWAIVDFPVSESARPFPVHPSTIVRPPGGLPSLSRFPSDSPPCSRSGTRCPRCDTSY